MNIKNGFPSARKLLTFQYIKIPTAFELEEKYCLVVKTLKVRHSVQSFCIVSNFYIQEVSVASFYMKFEIFRKH